MKRAIKNHLRDFAALLGLFVIAIVVAVYVLNEQGFTLPDWFPVIGKDFYVLEGEFTSAQAVTPGQGQSVMIAGVRVGEIAAVEVRNGRAIVTMNLEREYAPVYKNATMLLRPRTGLQDMNVQLDPGTSDAGEVPDGGLIPVSQTKPNVQFDEILATLDLDTRRSLQFLVNAGGYALDDQAGDLAAGLKRLEPTSKALLEITDQLAQRRRNLSRVITNFRRLTSAIAQRDTDLAGLISSSNAVFESLAAQDANIRETLALFPGTLESAQENLAKVESLANELGPTAEALRPTARSLGPALREVRPFLRETTPVIEDELRPFARDARPTVRALRDAAVALETVTPDLTTSLEIVNELLNALAYNPPGAEEGYLFWVAWANHLANSVFSGQDAHGPIRRGLVIANCEGLETIESGPAVFEQLEPLVTLSNFPDPAAVGCQAPGAAAADTSSDGEDGAAAKDGKGGKAGTDGRSQDGAARERTEGSGEGSGAQQQTVQPPAPPPASSGPTGPTGGAGAGGEQAPSDPADAASDEEVSG